MTWKSINYKSLFFLNWLNWIHLQYNTCCVCRVQIVPPASWDTCLEEPKEYWKESEIRRIIAGRFFSLPSLWLFKDTIQVWLWFWQDNMIEGQIKCSWILCTVSKYRMHICKQSIKGLEPILCHNVLTVQVLKFYLSLANRWLNPSGCPENDSLFPKKIYQYWHAKLFNFITKI